MGEKNAQIINYFTAIAGLRLQKRQHTITAIIAATMRIIHLAQNHYRVMQSNERSRLVKQMYQHMSQYDRKMGMSQS